jgi:hypothetical protein
MERINFEPLAAMTWQVHVYGSAGAELTGWCACHDVPLHVFDWRPEHEAAGLARDAIYLLRPDTYVALADASGARTLSTAIALITKLALSRRPTNTLNVSPSRIERTVSTVHVTPLDGRLGAEALGEFDARAARSSRHTVDLPVYF